jgi:hypothetical protein
LWKLKYSGSLCTVVVGEGFWTAVMLVPLPCTPGALLPLKLPASFWRSKL